jgi:hypothetical protein
MCKKSIIDPAKGLSNLEGYAKNKSRKVNSCCDQEIR